MTTDDFRRLALALPGAVESSHMNHPDFRVGRRIFATLGAPDEHHGMVKLTPEQQRVWLRKAPRVFHPASGAWGRGGATLVLLAAATKPGLRPALKVAWQNAVAQERPRARELPRSSGF
jgi:hypothetical protein